MIKEINPNTNAKTRLMLFAAEGDLNSTLKAISEGDDVNATDDHGGTALMYAVFNQHLEIVKALLNAGADLTLRTTNKRSAMYYALETNDEVLINCLAAVRDKTIKSGKDPLKRNQGIASRIQTNAAALTFKFCPNCGTQSHIDENLYCKCGYALNSQTQSIASYSGKSIKCKECGAQISSKAESCPKCGVKLKGKYSGCIIGVFKLIGGLVGGLIGLWIAVKYFLGR